MSSNLYNGTLVLGNSYSLGTGIVPLTSGNIQATASLTIPNALVISANANIGFTGSQNLTFTSATTTTTAAGINTFTNTNSGTVTFASVIGVGATTTNFAGTGTTILTAINTLAGTVNVNGGILSLAGANGSLLATIYSIGTGGTLQLDNTAVAKLSRLAAITSFSLNGGGFTILGNSGTLLRKVSPPPSRWGPVASVVLRHICPKPTATV